MAKKIDSTIVQDFIKQQMKVEKETLELAAMKAKLRKLEAKGYEHPLLRFEDNVSYRPDWKKIVKELAEKYMTKGPRAIFFNKTLPKRFPKTNGAKTITILEERYEAFHESLAAKKKQLGLTKGGE